MGDSGKGSQDQNVDRDVDSKGSMDEVSYGKTDSTGNQSRDYSCYAMAQNFGTFCLVSDSTFL